MREVSQNWLDNQNKTLRDQGLLRLDFLSNHKNNYEAHIIPMGSDGAKSNVNEIKEIFPYGAPSKNLAMPNLMGKPEISVGVYRLYNANGITIDYDVYSGVFEINGNTTTTVPALLSTSASNGNYMRSFYYVSGTAANNFRFWSFGEASGYDQTLGTSNFQNAQVISSSTNSSRKNIIYFYITSGVVFTNYKFKLQLEQGSTVTDYVVPQPNTGYVSSNISNTDGTISDNLVMPDLAGKTEISTGVYRLYNANGVTIDYEVFSGYFKINGVTSAVVNYDINIDFKSGSYTLRYYAVEGTLSGGGLNIGTNAQTFFSQVNQNVQKTGTLTMVSGIDTILRLNANSGRTFNNYTFALQLEVGTTATSYQLPNFIPIEVNVENYQSPLQGLTITWSKNLGHAVDYSIEYNGEIYTYLNNTKKTVFVPIAIENTPDANFKIRVLKWSEPNAPIRIERVFVGLHIIYEQNKIFNYSKKRINDVLSLELPQDEINFELSNIDRMFDPLWYNSYFKYLNEKTEIRVYSGFKLDGGEQWIKNGTFYLTDWKAPNNSITASFTAKDILGLLDADEMYSKSGSLTLDDYCDIILGRDYKGIDNYEDYNLPINPDGSKKWNIRKNLAVPDLTGKPEISDGVYRVYNANGITVDYDYWTGEYIWNGTGSGITDIFTVFNLISENLTYTIQYTYLSGSVSGGSGGFRIRYNVNASGDIYVDNSNQTVVFSNPTQLLYFRVNGQTFTNFKFKLQLEYGTEATDYELPIENAVVPVSMETRTKREVLQLLAQSVNAHIHLDDDANISFIRDVTGYNLNADKKIMMTKPEFNIAAPVKKIIVPISTYASDPNELELARVQVTAGETIEINHDLPYSGGRVEVSGSLTVVSQDNTWFRSYKIVVGGSGSGELVLYRHQMARTTINILQDVGSSGTTMTYENPMIDTSVKASRALTKIWSEISNSRQVEFELRIDPLFDTLDVVSFPFKVLELEQTEFMRIDELEINYNGAYKGKIKGVILSNFGGDLTSKTYIKHSDEFNSGEENLKWHLSNK